MKILLIQAPLGRKEKPVYPLGLSCLASAIADKHQVEVLDANVHSPERILEVIARFIPEVIGFGLRNIDTSLSFDSYFYFNHFPPFVRWIVKHSSKSVRVVGGSGFSLFPREVMEACPEIDLGVILEGEETFPNLLANLNKPETVFGVCYRDGKKIISAVVVLHLPEFEIVETASAVRKLEFPYIPGLLSFREAPVCIAA